MWIGGSQKGKGPFTWVDGSCFDFTAWRGGERKLPNEGEPSGTGENACIMKWKDGKDWNDSPCEVKRSYVCQKAVTVTG